MATYDVGNRSAIVTGGGSGIGEASAIVLAASGAAVLVVDLNEEHAQNVADKIPADGGVATALAGDVSDEAFAQVMVDEAGKLGPLKIAVNNAGIGGPLVQVADLSTDAWRKVIAVNLDAVFYGMRVQIPAMIAAGGGAIINMSSLAAVVGISQTILEAQHFFPCASYGVAKAGIEAFTRYIAALGASHNIRVNCVRPGQILTPRLTTESGGHRVGAILNQVQLIKGPGAAADVANAVLFLASDEARFITAEVMNIDGGAAAKL